MRCTALHSDRRCGSNVVAFVVGVTLLVLGLAIAIADLHVEEIDPRWINAGACLSFGSVLLVWVISDWTQWIGLDTVTMVVTVLTAIIAIFTLTREFLR
jgi:hypothetical protein